MQSDFRLDHVIDTLQNPNMVSVSASEFRNPITSAKLLFLAKESSVHIYNGSFPDPEFQRLVSTALMVFNDVILRVGIEFHLTVIDLRFVCCAPIDYANPIEPSSQGGAKIARTIVNLVMGVHPEDGARVVAS